MDGPAWLLQERLAALVEERKHVIEEEEHGGGKKGAAGAQPGGKAAHLENADMVSHRQGIGWGVNIPILSLRDCSCMKCTILEGLGACGDGMHVQLRAPPCEHLMTRSTGMLCLAASR